MTETAAAEVTPSASSSSGGLTLAVLAAAGVVLALAAAWVVPWLAIPVVWPLLFLVPGWGLLAFVRPRIAATGRLGLAIVLSVALSAHLVYWLSLATGGYRRETIFAVPSFVVSSAILAGALALLVHGLALTLLRGQGARRAALIAVVIVVFAGGLGWIRIIGDMVNGFGDPVALATTHSYDNSWYDPAGGVTWPYFRIPSVLGTGLLVHRATTAGLPMLVGAVLLLVAGLPTARQRAAGWRDRPALIGLAGLLGALLAPFHFFFFPAVPALAVLWAAAGGRL